MIHRLEDFLKEIKPKYYSEDITILLRARMNKYQMKSKSVKKQELR
jgi:hypothetical protein